MKGIAPGSVQQSVLDRLIEPVVPGREWQAKPRNDSLAELRAAVRRDLEALLNTRRRCRSWPQEMEELDRSLLAFGIPDFTGTGFATEDAQEEFCRLLERVIRDADGRLLSVRVERTANADPLDPTLRFRITAILHAEPAPEPLVLDSTLDPAVQSFQIRRGHE